MKNNIWLIGSGLMAIEYAKVLSTLEKNWTVVGRGQKNANAFEDQTGIKPYTGGLEKFLEHKTEIPFAVINAVGIEKLSETTRLLMDYGCKYILVEKPGFGNANELNPLVEEANNTSSQVLLAYNRRFYASVLKAKEIINEDGGVTSFCMEFTEWSHVIEKLNKTDVEWNNWFLGNSSHLIDTAFYLCGQPVELQAFVSGQNNLKWHPASSIFSGAGKTTGGALFSYHANWEGPGRWWLEIITKKRRLIFKPMEKLQVQKTGSVQLEDVQDIDYTLDQRFKPGLFLQTKNFLQGDYNVFCSIAEQKNAIEKYYKKIAGYT